VTFLVLYISIPAESCILTSGFICQLISVGSINQKTCWSCCWWQKRIKSIQKTLQGVLLFSSCWHWNLFLVSFVLLTLTLWRNVTIKGIFSAHCFIFLFIALISARSFDPWAYNQLNNTMRFADFYWNQANLSL
jgi:hypothetical protein